MQGLLGLIWGSWFKAPALHLLYRLDVSNVALDASCCVVSGCELGPSVGKVVWEMLPVIGRIRIAIWFERVI